MQVILGVLIVLALLSVAAGFIGILAKLVVLVYHSNIGVADCNTASSDKLTI